MKATRLFIFVTAVFGNIRIEAHNIDDAWSFFEERGYAHTDCSEIR